MLDYLKATYSKFFYKFVTLNPNYLEKEDCIRNFGKLVNIFNLSSVAILQMIESILNVIPKV